MNAEVFIYDAVRTPRGKGKMGAPLSALAPQELVRQLVDALRERHGEAAIAGAERLVLSCVGQTGDQGGHIAMVGKLHAGLADATIALTINNFCSGGLSAVALAAATVRAGDAGLVLAGGVEMMSRVPFLADQAPYYADPALSEQLRYVPVALSADYLAHRFDVTREELDVATINSHRRARAAWDAGRYDRSVVAMRDEAGKVLLDPDETIRDTMTMEGLGALPPAFVETGAAGVDAMIDRAKPGTGPIDHRHSIANCPPIADGAGLVLVGSAAAGTALGLAPLAKIEACVEAAGDPIDQLTSGEAAMDRLLAKTGRTLADLDLVEYMEAFAVVPSLFYRRADVDPEIVNVNGGHLAMGHPMGATGAILTATLVEEMARRDAAQGLVVTHGGSGVGTAALLTRA
ncbi:MAG: acetyl-CoA C-acyltransferase [Parasphingopyxis sp.]|uniref:acetyl-CoA C-acyltransferase n=1 Tax=Parasphingopyxis sp. TaxID=1920299 RepID=UPI003F9F2F5E